MKPLAEATAAMETTHPVVVAIITYNSADHLLALVESLRDDETVRQILVVDNDSTDETVSRARTMPGVTVIATGANLGYSGGINVARRLLEPGDALAVLNPDLVLAPGSLGALSNALRDHSVGIAVPLLRDPDGSVYPHLRREPSIVGSLGDAMFGAHWPDRPRWMSDTLRRLPDYAAGRDIAWAGGAALMISPNCSAAVGPWDSETYFLYSEEADYAGRAREAGFRIRFVPTAEATHVGGGSSGQPAELVALMAVNRVRYFEARHSAFSSAAFRAVVTLHHLLRARDRRHRFAARVVARRKAWRDLPSGTKTRP
ncbi:MAG: glycosyltransferase family 2 protein [Microbacteriaceae bacterium]|nr:glycosyltransferase family 2 protein [Microbacteriaceae bacterium]